MDLSGVAMGERGEMEALLTRDVPQSHWHDERNAGAMEIQGMNTEFVIFHSV